MTKKLVLASAGAGKTYRIVSEAIQSTDAGHKVLVITYTENNQAEIIKKYKELKGRNRKNFHVKGLFTFLLQDIIRPYQRCIFQDRIESINFNQSDPHKANGRTIPGRKEVLEDGTINPNYYLTVSRKKAHTTYLSKLAARIIKESNGKPIARLEAIYSHIYIDEVQDLVGWDYDILQEMAKSKKINITCVGDFRQTIYQTAMTQKKPKTAQEKLGRFAKMGFANKPMNVSRRSIQSVCDIADGIHENDGYKKTKTLVTEVPEKLEYREHIGVFIVKKSEAVQYIQKYKPVLLRNNIRSGKEFRAQKINFGKSKGMGFDRVLILPTKSYIEYLKGGCEKSCVNGLS